MSEVVAYLYENGVIRKTTDNAYDGNLKKWALVKKEAVK